MLGTRVDESIPEGRQMGSGEFLTISNTPSRGRISINGIRPMCGGTG